MESYDELSAKDMLKEIARPRRFLKAAKVTKEEFLGWTFLRFVDFVIEYELSDLLPNLTVAIRFFLTLSVSVPSCKRSFFKLTLLKNFLRPTMDKARFSYLGLFLIENCVAKNE